MAYLKPKQTVFFAQGNITSIVEKVAFRKYLTKPKLNKDTGEYKRKWKSMPYAICKVLMSDDSLVPVGEQFLIAGYRLQKKYLQGKMILVMNNEYVADYENEYGNRWVSKMIQQEREKDEERKQKAAEYRAKSIKKVSLVGTVVLMSGFVYAALLRRSLRDEKTKQ